MAVVQLVEHLVVVQDVAGSSPVSHPTAPALARRGSFILSGGQCDSTRGGVNPFVRREIQEL